MPGLYLTGVLRTLRKMLPQVEMGEGTVRARQGEPRCHRSGWEDRVRGEYAISFSLETGAFLAQNS